MDRQVTTSTGAGELLPVPGRKTYRGGRVSKSPPRRTPGHPYSGDAHDAHGGGPLMAGELRGGCTTKYRCLSAVGGTRQAGDGGVT